MSLRKYVSLFFYLFSLIFHSFSFIFPDTYEVCRKDRRLTGGGVFIAVRNDLAAVQEHRLDVGQCEIITVSLKFPRTKKLLISNYYRPPSSDTNSLEILDNSNSNFIDY